MTMMSIIYFSAKLDPRLHWNAHVFGLCVFYFFILHFLISPFATLCGWLAAAVDLSYQIPFEQTLNMRFFPNAEHVECLSSVKERKKCQSKLLLLFWLFSTWKRFLCLFRSIRKNVVQSSDLKGFKVSIQVTPYGPGEMCTHRRDAAVQRVRFSSRAVSCVSCLWWALPLSIRAANTLLAQQDHRIH